MLAKDGGRDFDSEGQMAAQGQVNEELLRMLNNLGYYKEKYPKTLANEFGTDVVYPIIKNSRCEINDALRTYVEHIVLQIKDAITEFRPSTHDSRILVTGGGALNIFLVKRLEKILGNLNVTVVVPDENLVKYKEAMIMAFMGVLRWRQEYNVFSSVTGAKRDSINGALWTGQEA